MALPMTPYEEDLQRAHYFALGALHHYKVPTWEEKYELATGFAHGWVKNMARGLDAMWDAYVTALVTYKQRVQAEQANRGWEQGHDVG